MNISQPDTMGTTTFIDSKSNYGSILNSLSGMSSLLGMANRFNGK